ncbi:hypothetical protein GMORB2_2202 [Geosmithia morbida]|uniref:Ubiquitin carboxyl-terminal hydrolase 19 n=1 Tax=Geosmithia morbida TaxID=1094350 RepID=A0A9P4YSG9_9HYPO|nr:uncharacterized protein GMORB2_2202 [Geosmithia morbida]KAF4121240.1 hypothetical protein GMORB2_2202 [Geosmithia morbida]
MDPRFGITPEDLYTLQMEVKQVHYTQSNHAERLMRLEKRQADDAALKSVWNSPFPGILSGTPQHGPVSQPDDFDDFDEQGDQLLGSLHLGPAEEEPVRRGAASRANSVRFDESALHGSSWAGHTRRPSGDLTPARPGSGLFMERSLSHKSDGRHSSAGHSVHSHHSMASGQASSLGLDTNFAVEDDDDSSLDIPGPPPAFYILGTVPSIVRCWLTTNYAHATLLYADICTGSQKSTVDDSLVKELGLGDEAERGADGTWRIRLNVYLSEAVVVHHSGRSPSLDRPIPFISVLFEITGTDGPGTLGEGGGGVRIFIGSDALRAHSADIMFSRNTMILYGDDKSRLRVPFVRPEDETSFENISTTNVMPEKPRLNANAAPFILADAQETPADEQQPKRPLARSLDDHEAYNQHVHQHDGAVSPTEAPRRRLRSSTGPPASASDTGGESERSTKSRNNEAGSAKRDGSVASETGGQKVSSSGGGGIWSSWRQGTGSTGGSGGVDGPLSGYQPAAARGGRNMKVLKPQKSASSTSARTGASYEPPPPTAGTGSREGRRKSQASASAGPGEQTSSSQPQSQSQPTSRWEQGRRAASSGSEAAKSSAGRESTRQSQSQTLSRSANSVGGAMAFSWMGSPVKPKSTTTAQ